MTVAMVLGSFLLTWAIALPLGIYAAVKKYSIFDYGAGFIGFFGLAVPSFVLAIILLYFTYVTFGKATIGLFSPEFADAPWSAARFIDLLKHLWVPALLAAMTGIGGLTQTMRANLLDELNKPYVNTARSKGLSEGQAAVEVSGAARAQPIHQHHRLVVACAGVGQCHHLHRAKLAYSGFANVSSDNPARPIRRRRFHPRPQRPHRRRHVRLGLNAGVAGPTNSH